MCRAAPSPTLPPPWPYLVLPPPPIQWRRLIDSKSISGFPPLTYAVAWEHIDSVEALLDYDPNLLCFNSSPS